MIRGHYFLKYKERSAAMEVAGRMALESIKFDSKID